MWNRKRVLSMALGMAMVSSSVTPAAPVYGGELRKEQGESTESGQGVQRLKSVQDTTVEDIIWQESDETASVSNAEKRQQEGTHIAVYEGEIPEIETDVPLDAKDFREPYSTVTVTAKDGVEYQVEVVPKSLVYFVDSGVRDTETSPAFEAVAGLVTGLKNDRADAQWSEGADWGYTGKISVKSEVSLDDKDATGFYGGENKANNPISYKFALPAGTYTITSCHKDWWSNSSRTMEMSISYGDKTLQAGSVTSTGINEFTFTLEEDQMVTYTINNTNNQAPLISWVAVAEMDENSAPSEDFAGPLEDQGKVSVRTGAKLEKDLEDGSMITVTEGWISGGNSAANGGGVINNALKYFKQQQFTLYTDFTLGGANGEGDDNTSALLIGNGDNHIRLIPKTNSGKAVFRVHTGGEDKDYDVNADIARGVWHSIAVLYSEDGEEGTVTLCLDGETVLDSAGIGFKLSQQTEMAAGYGITYKTGYMRTGSYDNIMVAGIAAEVSAAREETAKRAAEKKKLQSKPGSIVIDGTEVSEAAKNMNGLTFKGFGVLDCNSTNALLLDYKAQQPEKYWEMMEILFGGEHPIMQHIKIEMGNDKNNSTGSQACTMRYSDEYPDVTRVTGFQLAADAKKINPNVKVSLLYWRSPGWVGDKSNWDNVYKWMKNTTIAAYRKYGYMIDIISPGVNEDKDDINWIKEFRNRILNDKDGMVSEDGEAAGFREGEEELFHKIQVIISDEVGIASCGSDMVHDEELRNAVDIVGYHYNTDDDSQGNFTRLAEEFDKEIWNSEAQATFGSTADRPNNNMVDNADPGTGIGGNGGPLEMANTIIKGFVNSRRTHFVYQPTFGAFYEGTQYNYKDVMAARDPWSGYVNYDGALNIMQHFTKFAVTGWEYDTPDENVVWRGIPGASKSTATGTNPVNGRNGGDNYMTLAAPDGSNFSVILNNDSGKEKIYSICPRDMGLAEGAGLEVWETRAAEDGKLYNANYMKCVEHLTPDTEGAYTVTVKPWSIVTVTTLDMDSQEALLALPAASEDGRYVLDTDDTGKTQNIGDEYLYADDFNYVDKEVTDYKDGEIIYDTGLSFMESRGGSDGFYPLYTQDVNGSFEVVMKDGENGVLKMNGQTGGSAWNGGDPATILGDYRWTNYKASVDFDLTSAAGDMLLGVRQRGAAGGGDNKVSMSAYNLALNRSGNWTLRRYGEEIAKGKADISNPSACNVAIQAAGDTVTAYIEGTEIYTYKDPNPQLEGRIMLGSGWEAAEFDNLKVETVPGYTPYFAMIHDNLHMKKWDGDHAGEDALVYTGKWSHVNQKGSNYSQRSLSSTSETGASVSYTFDGTGFALISGNSGSAKANVTIDGKEAYTDMPTISTSSHQPYLMVRGLEKGPHTVEISLASGNLDVDSFAYIAADGAVSEKVDVSGLKGIVEAIKELDQNDYDPTSWQDYQAALADGYYTLEMAGRAMENPVDYGADQEGIDDMAACLESLADILVRTDAPVKILSAEELPKVLAISAGGTIEDLKGGTLPSAVKVENMDGTVNDRAEITWKLSGNIGEDYSEAEVVGTVTGGRDLETGKSLTVSIPVGVVPAGLVYFIDPGTEDTTVYDLYKSVCPELKNETNDKLYEDGSWGRGQANVKDGTNSLDKFDTGIWSADDIVYTLPMEAGIYTLTAGFTEWWGSGRDMSQTISYTLSDGTVKTISGDAVSFGGKGKATSSTTFVVPEAVTVTYRLAKTKSQDSVISWLGVSQVGPQEEISWSPIFISNENNQWAGLLTQGTVTMRQDPEQGEVLHMNAAGTTYAQIDPQAIDFTGRENMTMSFDVRSETADGNFFTVAIGQNDSKYFYMRTHADNIHTAITKGSWQTEETADADADTYEKWLHIDLVFTPERIATYVDGLEASAINKTLFVTDLGRNPIVYLGKSFYSGDKYFAGAFDNIEVYNRARGAEELELSYAVGEAKKLKERKYTPESWAVFSQALTEAKSVLEDETAAKEQQTEAKDALQAAMDALVKRVYTAADLEEAVKKAEALNPSDYTADSWKAVEDALNGAKEVLAAENPTEEQIAAGVENLEDACDALEKKPAVPEEKADTTELEAAIKAAEALKAEDYTADSWKAVEDALKAAKEVLAAENPTQKQVDGAAEALKAACEALEKKQPAPAEKADTTELEAAIKAAEALKAEDYTADSWKAVEDALKAAKEVLGAENPTQKQVDDVAAALKAACEALEKKQPAPAEKADTTQLEAAIKEAEALKADDYTADSWKAVEDALKAAKEVLGLENPTQKQVDDAAKTLKAACDALEKKEPVPTEKADTTELEAAIKEAEALKADDYTADSWKAVEDALKAAKEVLGAENPTQKQVDDAAKTLKAACEALEKKEPVPAEKADTTQLEAAIKAAEALKADDYTADSWKAVEDALKAAKEVLGAENPTQKQVDDAAKTLKAACEALEKKEPVPAEKADTTQLEAAVKAAEALKAGDYTADSWKAVEDALKAAKEVLGLENPTQQQVDDAAAALKAACEALKKSNKSPWPAISGGTTHKPSHSSTDRDQKPQAAPAGNGHTTVTGNIPSGTREGTWKQETDGTWRLTKEDGSDAANEWAFINDKWYLFDADGDMVQGWASVNGTWYYCNPENGDMAQGWVNVNGTWYYCDPVNGDMKTGWQMINGKWYYLDAVNGDMKTGRIQVDHVWYDLAEDGSLIQ